MLSPVGGACCGQRVYHARSCYGLALWAGRIRQPHPFWSKNLQPGDGGSQGEGPALSARAVEPAAYVELRALDAAKAENDLQMRSESARSESLVRRLWPFRWPVEAVAGSEEAKVRIEHEAPVKRAYLDVVV